MNRCLILLLLGLATVAWGRFKLDLDKILDDDEVEQFSKFRSRFKKNCTDGADECKKRKKNFAANWKRMKKVNQSSFTVGETQFMDWSPEEMQKMVFDPSRLPITKNHTKNVPQMVRQKRANIGTLDYRTFDFVGPIKNQGGCGSCWAFSSVAAIEIASNKKNGRTGANKRTYSEQYVLDCTSGSTCVGGWPSAAQTLVVHQGLPRAQYLAYNGVKGTCPATTVEKPLIGLVDLTNNADRIITHLQTTGPVVACFIVCSDFYYYTSGIYSNNCKYQGAGYVGGHAVTIIGYGTENGMDYWLVRNSWGTGWGIQGYFKIQRGVDMASFESWEVTAPLPATIA
ncbi:unnamed protein product, partial [Mesorhabditis spiculigera]